VMINPAYIAIGADGHVTLYWGDGTEEQKEIILHGPRVTNNREFIEVIEDMKAWAEENGYTVIVPSYDFEEPDAIVIDIPEDEADRITIDDVDDLIDDLLNAENDDDDWYPSGEDR
jgi:poly(3-hydroxybutyrate) depolymerase